MPTLDLTCQLAPLKALSTNDFASRARKGKARVLCVSALLASGVLCPLVQAQPEQNSFAGRGARPLREQWQRLRRDTSALEVTQPEAAIARYQAFYEKQGFGDAQVVASLSSVIAQIWWRELKNKTKALEIYDWAIGKLGQDPLAARLQSEREQVTKGTLALALAPVVLPGAGAKTGEAVAPVNPGIQGLFQTKDTGAGKVVAVKAPFLEDKAANTALVGLDVVAAQAKTPGANLTEVNPSSKGVLQNGKQVATVQAPAGLSRPAQLPLIGVKVPEATNKEKGATLTTVNPAAPSVAGLWGQMATVAAPSAAGQAGALALPSAVVNAGKGAMSSALPLPISPNFQVGPTSQSAPSLAKNDVPLVAGQGVLALKNVGQVNEKSLLSTTIVSQIAGGALTAEQAWQDGSLTVEGVYDFFEHQLNPWGEVQGQEGQNDNRLRLSMAGVLVNHGGERLKDVSKVPLPVRVWLADYFQNQRDARVMVWGESVLSELKAPKNETEERMTFQVIERIATYQEAEGKFEQAATTWLRYEPLTKDPTSLADMYIGVARLKVKDGKLEQAQQFYAQAKKQGDAWMTGLAAYDQSQALLEQGQNAPARVLLQKSLEGAGTEPVKVALLTLLAYSYWRTGEKEQAGATARKAVKAYEALGPNAPDRGLKAQVEQARQIIALVNPPK